MQYLFSAKATCPPSWTLEYRGYIMTSYIGHGRSRSMFVCIDEDQGCLPGSASTASHQFGLHHVEAGCSGIPSPPYDPNKEVNCIVCTK